MTLRDISNGPDWVIWVVFAIFLVITIFMLLGKGAFLIAGYNTLPDKEKEKYDEKVMCRIVGIGLLLIDILIAIMGIGEDVLPAECAFYFAVFVLVDVIVMQILMKKIAKKS